MRVSLFPCSTILLFACHGQRAVPSSDAGAGVASAIDAGIPETAAVPPLDATPDAAREAAATPFAAWLEQHLPEGGSVEASADGGAPRVIHTVKPGDTSQSVAEAYVGLTDVY